MCCYDIDDNNEMNDMSTYGTNNSTLLKDIIRSGYNPVGITIMMSEEVFIFTDENEAKLAASKFTPEGFWYGMYEWVDTYREYVDSFYGGEIDKSSNVYILNDVFKNFLLDNNINVNIV